MHALDGDGADRIVRAHGYRVVLLEVPEGARAQATGLARRLAALGCRAAVWAGTCWGPCDLHERDVAPYVDAILHFGHTAFPGPAAPSPVPVHHLALRYDGAIPPRLVSSLRRRLDGRRAALLSTAQYLHLLPGLAKALGGADRPRGRFAPGQVTGCDLSAARAAPKTRALVFVGTGRFHPLGAALATGREVLDLDLELGRIASVGEGEAEALQRKRYLAIARALDAERWGVYLSTKSGQARRDEALRLIGEIEGAGREGLLVAADDLSPDALRPLKIDALASTACPRIALDDGASYPVPVLTPIEAEIALGLRPYEAWSLPLG